MSTEVDQRVVEMRFDNKQFESGIKTSLDSLDNLKKGLDLKDSAKGFDEISKAAKNCDISHVGNAVESVKVKFSVLEEIARGALLRIGNQAMAAGQRIVSSLTIDPIKAGFSEYELKMGSIQTIMSSTGESLDRVNQKLDELNEYSDRTIYSFSDMTSNIGKFTNAGVKLDDAVAAIQGVSNVAAVSGANANEASRAMYNFAQALSAGYVKLIDWKSIENANMATVEFKTQLLESAVAAGTLTKTADGMYKTLEKGTVIDATHLFNDSLQEQWMTTEVLTSTLKDYADETTEIGKKAFAAAQDVKTWTQLLDTLKESAQSGWAETWQLVVGDYEEAKETLRTFSEFFSGIIDGSADARNSLLQGALMSSWGQIKKEISETGMSTDTFRDTLRETAEESVKGLDKMIEEAGSFEATFEKGWLTTDILADTLDKVVSKAAGTATSIDELSDEQLKNIGYTQDQVDSLRALSKEAKTSGSNISKLVDTIGRQSGRELIFDSLLNSAKAVQGIFFTIKEAWRDIFPATTAERLYSFIESIHAASERLRDFFTQVKDESGKFSAAVNKPLQNIKNTFKGLFAVIDIVKQAFSALIKAIAPAGNAAGSLISKILELTGSFGEWLVKLDETIKKNNTFTKAIQKVVDWVKQAIVSIKEFAEALRERFDLPTLDEAKESVKRFVAAVREKIAAPGLELIKALFEKLCELAKRVKEAVFDMRDGVVDSFTKIDDAAGKSRFGIFLEKVWGFLVKVANVIGDLLSNALHGLIELISNGDFDKLMDILSGASITAIGVSISKFVNGLTKGLDSVGKFKDNLLNILNGVKGCMEAWQKDIQANTLMKIAIAIGILSGSLIALALVDSDKLMTSLTAITALFAELLGSFKIFAMFGEKGSLKATTTLIGMAVAVAVLAGAMKKLSTLDWDGLAKGTVGILVLTKALVSAANQLSGKDKSMTKGAVGLIAFAVGIRILASAVNSLAQLSWADLAKGLLGVGALMTEIDLFLATAKFKDGALTTAVSIIALSLGIKILASACKALAKLSWEEIGKGLAGIAGLLAEIVAFTRLVGKPEKFVSIGVGLIAVGAAMKIFASVMGGFGNMSWESIGKGLVAMGGALAELAIGLNLMKGTLLGSTSLVVASLALLTLVPVFAALGSMKWSSIIKGLVAAAGAFTILGVAGALLSGMAVPLLALAGAFTLLGVGAMLLATSLVVAGAGLTSIGVGLGALSGSLSVSATAIVASIAIIIGGILDLIPMMISKLGDIIVAICEAIAAAAPAIAKAVKEIVLALIVVLVECVPPLVEGILIMFDELLASLVAHTPGIVDKLMQFLIGLIDGIARNLPQLIVSVMNLIGAFFQGIVDALNSVDTDNLIKSIVAVGLVAGLVVALSAIGPMVPGAMLGLLGVGAIIAEMSAVLAAIGALESIPGFGMLVDKGGDMLERIGRAIGKFIGGIVGGIAEGVTSSFPNIATDLSEFMTNLQPFVDGASKIKPEMMDGVKAIAEVILLLTASNILDGLTSWFTGGSSMTQFAEDLVPLGYALNEFGATVANLDGDLISKAAIAGKTLAEMAATLPNSGGVVGWFMGENDMDKFGEQLVSFGSAMNQFATSVKNINPETVTKAAEAGEALSAMAKTLPNTGGVVGWFMGDNDMDTFGEQLVVFGDGMAKFYESIKGIKPDVVKKAAEAGEAISAMANTLPNSGGIVSWFTGNNDMDKFGKQLEKFGKSLAMFYESVKSVVAIKITSIADAGSELIEMASLIPTKKNKAVDKFSDNLVSFGKGLSGYYEEIKNVNTVKVVASKQAGKALIEVAKELPKSGGIFSWFTGNSDLGKFGEQITKFGEGMKSYGDAVVDLKPESVVASAAAGKALVKLAQQLPNTGGLFEFILGGKDLSLFGEQIVPFGKAMREYSIEVADLKSEAVVASAAAGNALVKLSQTLPNTGGAIEFFTGGKDLAKFADEIVPFGTALKEYGDEIADLKPSTVAASANAALFLAELQNALPNSGGVVDFFTGTKDLAKFADEIVPFGTALKKYGDEVADLKPDVVASSTDAGSALVELANTLPNTGGLIEWFTGRTDLEDFGSKLAPFGEALAAYGAAVENLPIEAVSASATAGETLASLAATLPETGGLFAWFAGDHDMVQFGEDLVSFGESMSKFGETVKDVQTNKIKWVAEAGQALADLSTSLENTGGLAQLFTGSGNIGTFGENLEDFGESISTFSDTLSGVSEDFVAHVTNVSNGILKMGEVDVPRLNEVVDAVREIVSIASEVDAIDSDGITTFADAMGAFAEDGTTSFVSKLRTSLLSAKSEISDYIADLAHEVSANKSKVTTEFKSIVDSAIDKLDDAHDDFYETGKYLVDGLIDGIEGKTSQVKRTAETMADAIVRATKNELVIHSPSRVMRDEVGHYIVEGITEGIEKNTSAEEAAAKKAQNIVNAFKTELEKSARSMTTLDLEFSLWEATEGYGASDETKNLRQIETLSGKLSPQEERVKLAQGEWENMVKEFGENSKEAEESYQKLLKEQTELAKLQNEIVELQNKNIEIEKSHASSRLDAADNKLDREYSIWEKQSNSDEITLESNMKQIEYYANKLGIQSQRVSSAQKAVDDAIRNFGESSEEALAAESELLSALETQADLKKSIDDIYKSEEERDREAYLRYVELLRGVDMEAMEGMFSEEEIQKAMAEQAGWSQGHSKELLDNIVEQASKATEATAELYSEVASGALESQTSTYTDVGSEYAKAMNDGFKTTATSANASIKEIATACGEALIDDEVKDGWLKAGETLIDCFVQGITTGENDAANAAKKIASVAFEAAKAASEAAAEAYKAAEVARQAALSAQSAGHSALSAVARYENAAANMKSASIGTPMMTVESATIIGAGHGAGSTNPGHGTGHGVVNNYTYEFTQNNTSPVALSQREIYRQTNNQFSQLKNLPKGGTAR